MPLPSPVAGAAKQKPATTIAASPRTLTAVSRFCVHFPSRTPEDIDAAEDEDGSGGIGRQNWPSLVYMPQSRGVVGEDVGQGADVARPNDPELGPGEQEAGWPSQAAGEVDVHAPILGICGGQFREAQGPDERQHPPKTQTPINHQTFGTEPAILGLDS